MWPLGSLTVLSAKACPPAEVIRMKFPLEFYCFYEWPRAPDQPLQKHWGVGCSICFSFTGERDGGWLWVSCDTVCVLHYLVLPCASVRQRNTWHSSSCRQENSVCKSGQHTVIQNNAGSNLTSHRLVLVSMAWQCASLTKSHHGSTVDRFQKVRVRMWDL